MQRIVIKLGTQVVMETQDVSPYSRPRLAFQRLQALMQPVCHLKAQGHEVLIVTSGAVGLGREALGLWGKISLTEKQACAAVGQSLLMNAYREMFLPAGQVVAQVLLTAEDFSQRQRYLALRNTLEKLLALGVIPVLNENDAVSVAELKPLQENEPDSAIQEKSFGDNDTLSALVAAKLDADLLVLLTNVDGVYTDNPATHRDARPIDRIETLEGLSRINVTGQSLLGRGGMASKLDAARLAALSGTYTLITSGLQDVALTQLVNGLKGQQSYSAMDLPGTLVFPQGRLAGRKRWIAMASGTHGVVVVNTGAKQALIERQASLLPSGIVQVLGQFAANQVISIQDENGQLLGRGISHFSALQARQLIGRHSSKIAQILGAGDYPTEMIHRDNLVTF